MNGIGPSQEAWESSQLLQALQTWHPTSREALLLRRGAFLDVDPEIVATYGNAWAVANPNLAQIDDLLALLDHNAPPPDTSEPASSRNAESPTAPASWLAMTRIAPFAVGQEDPSNTSVAVPSSTVPATGAVTQAILGSESPLDQRAMYEGLKKTTVLVIELANTRSGLRWVAHGTGSFIGPRLILTNTHVVESKSGVPGQAFLVVNRELGVSRAVLRARGMAASGTGIDAAILETVDIASPFYLGFASEYLEGDEVVLSGFAGKANVVDQAFIDLKDMVNSGVIPGAQNIPLPKFSSGRVQSIFVDALNGLQTISADIEAAKGASGSALTNQRGNLVALLHSVSRTELEDDLSVDTANYNYSVTALEVMKWLDSARIPFTKVDAPCLP